MSNNKKNRKQSIREQVNEEYYGVSFEVKLDPETMNLHLSCLEELDAKPEPEEDPIPEKVKTVEEPIVPWIPDKATYGEIQKLIEFVDFVRALETTSDEDRKIAGEVKQILRNIDQPEARKDFSVRLDIVDWNVQNQQDREGVYRRSWWLYFEQNRLWLDVETMHTDNPIEHSGPDFYYYGMICFNEYEGEQNVFLDDSTERFVEDAKNFRSYMSKMMNELESDIKLW